MTATGPGAGPGASPGAERLGGDPPSPWEERYGFSRVVRAGGFVLIGGTTAVMEGGAVAGDSPYEQATEILRKVAHELARARASMADVIQSRVYVVDIAWADEVGRAHREAFGAGRPLMTMIQVTALIDPRLLVEIEVVALDPGARPGAGPTP